MLPIFYFCALPAATMESASVPVAGSSNVDVAAAAATATCAAATSAPSAATTTPLATSGKPNDWVVIPVFADIVKLALGERENCLQR